MKFNELAILPALETALIKENITVPTQIQEHGIPVIIDGKDVFISSETGSGKTLAYLLPLISKLDLTSKNLQVIIVTPTYELCSQIQDQLIKLNQNSGLGVRSQLLIGSASTKRQLEKLKKKPHIVVGSAGRILDLIKMKKLKVHAVNSMVIDEADKMLFGEEMDLVEDILRSMLKERQLIYVSATNQPESNETIASLSPALVSIHTQSNKIVDDIEHICFTAHENDKPKLLCKIINACDPERAIVFTHRNETAGRIARKLAEHKISVGELHGECDKQTRLQAINRFRNGKVKILVASDMAARGLDIKGVTHIFNVDAPGKSKDYLHRAGRTGRAGAHGYCISLMSGEEQKIVRRYERELKIIIKQASIYEGVITYEKKR
ncbi:MAG: DEAD/DEAH box helicase [Victivallaceae bacterium]|nr:DEAD/DEAH box helicase [Victivallaceae bacterium]